MGNNTGRRGARAGRAALCPRCDARRRGWVRGAQRRAGGPRRGPPCPAGGAGRRATAATAAAAGGGAGLGAAALGDILSGSEGPGRRHPPLAGDRATPPRRQGAGLRAGFLTPWR